MLTRTELYELERSLRGTKVLSVYLTDTAADPAERTVWRWTLSRALAETRATLGGASHAEREAFERAVALVEERLAALPEGLRFAGWVAFATPDGVRHAEVLRVPMPVLVAWGDGIRVAPYVRALARQGAAAVGIVDSRTARVYAYRDGVLEGHGTLHAETHLGPVLHMGDHPRPGFHPGTRGVTGTDAAERARRTGRLRLLRALAERLVPLAAPDGWVLVGGIPTVASAALARLPDDVRVRARAIAGLDVHATAAQIAAHVESAVAALQREADAAAVAEILDRYAAGGTGSVGRQGTQESLREGAVDRLYFSERFLHDEPLAAEAAVQAAFDEDAAVACVGGAAAERLDAEAGGIAARLRFVPAREQPPLTALAP
jgi:hypothetical protein